MTPAISEISRNRACRIYAALVILHISLVWLIPHFPTQDGPSHLYNLVILHDLLNGGTDWGGNFTYSLKAVPNLGFHLIAYPLISIFPPYAAEKIFISIYLLLMTVSVPLYLRAFGREPMPLSFLVFPLLFNFPFMMGFYSFAIAVPCMLLAISAAWSLRSGSPAKRFLVLNLAGIALFFVHLIPFVIYLLSVCIMLTVPNLCSERPFWKPLLRAAVITPSGLLCLLYLLVSRGEPQSPGSYSLSTARFLELLGSLLVFSTDTFSRWQLLAWVPLFIILYVLAKTGWKEKHGPPEQREINRTLFTLVLALLLIYFSLPADFGGGDFFNQRLPWIIVLLSLPLLKVPSSGPVKRLQMLIFPGIAILFLLMNSVILKQQSDRVEEFLSGMHADIPKGSYVATYKQVEQGWTRVDPLLHAASHYGIRKKCIDAGNYELASGISFVRLREHAPILPGHDWIAFHPDQVDWSRYPAIRFLLGWEVDGKGKLGPATGFSPVSRKGRFSLWRRKPA